MKIDNHKITISVFLVSIWDEEASLSWFTMFFRLRGYLGRYLTLYSILLPFLFPLLYFISPQWVTKYSSHCKFKTFLFANANQYQRDIRRPHYCHINIYYPIHFSIGKMMKNFFHSLLEQRTQKKKYRVTSRTIKYEAIYWYWKEETDPNWILHNENTSQPPPSITRHNISVSR